MKRDDEDKYLIESKILVRHPKYNIGKPYKFDIGLIKLSEEIKFNNYIKPVLLPPTYMDMKYIREKICSVSGFGNTKGDSYNGCF